MKIYTKKGDKGETRMLFGDAVSKDDLAPDAYGSVDELVAALGLIRADKNLPIEVQENVFAQIFPNPSNNYFSIRLTGEWRKQFEVKVYDVQGKLIFENQGYASHINIATNSYAEGLYFVEINDGIHQMVKKITVQH